MNNTKFEIFWTENAKEDLKEIYISLKIKISKETALKIRDELFNCTDEIVFAEQFQFVSRSNKKFKVEKVQSKTWAFSLM
jgi:hypothetical protein